MDGLVRSILIKELKALQQGSYIPRYSGSILNHVAVCQLFFLLDFDDSLNIVLYLITAADSTFSRCSRCCDCFLVLNIFPLFKCCSAAKS